MKPSDTPSIMRFVLLALVPGVLMMLPWLGWALLVQVALAAAFGIGIEAACLRLRGAALKPHLLDGSAVVSAVLIALCLPPGVPWYLLAIALAGGIGLAKHAYGGMGNNLLNPAMAGYALVLVAFPSDLATWVVDGVTAATPLEVFRFRGASTVAEVWPHAFGVVGGIGWEWMNLGFLIGGLCLLAMGIIRWQAPVAFLVSLVVCASFGYDGGSSSSLGSPAMHLFTGGTMLCAWFVVTDPVTAPASARGRLIFGALIGVLVFLIRSFGAYADGIAFAVLLGNISAPLIDEFVRRKWA
ncbi:MAG: RnfABCDGE type electron transport complex subunit D [Gammaproteobacteria bacterium]|nr:RnfABCDGE type electron transport complex subunit D [Gammaproteobacteria bacterium]